MKADDAELRKRLVRREKHPEESASDAHLAIWPALRGAFQEPVEFPDAIVIDTMQPVADCIEAALAHVFADTTRVRRVA